MFSTEQVSKWHPDKYADQISDAILTAYLCGDENAHCGIETMVKGETVVLGGEISSTAKIGKEGRRVVVDRVAKKLGYEASKVVDLISEQSPEIAEAVNKKETCAGDQGMVYGYATDDENHLPVGFNLANKLIRAHESRVWTGLYAGDAKCQVTMDGDRIDTVVFSACMNPWIKDTEAVNNDLERMIDEVLLDYAVGKVRKIINPSGAWTIGGPTADCGLTGRKIVCDQYGGYCPVGGGAFSGKDPSKVDRTGAYMARAIAVDLVDLYGFHTVAVQMGFAIGLPDPVSVEVQADGQDFPVEKIRRRYDLSVDGMINWLDLKHRDYERVAEGCHYRPHSDGGII